MAGYGQDDILRGVDLELEEGTITCLIGPNGAGKSTVLRTLSGLLQPRTGRIVFEGEEIGGLVPGVLARGVVHVPQERSLFPLMTVWDNVLMGGHIAARPGARARRASGRRAVPVVAERRRERPARSPAASRRSSRSPAR